MEKNEILQKTKLFLFDMDGTLYLGDRLYDFTLELLQTIRETGRRYLFMTNILHQDELLYLQSLNYNYLQYNCH